MASRLEGCPAEIFEQIVQLLDFEDILSLRRVSRAVIAKATQNHFKSYFRTKHVKITRTSLQAFVEATRPGGFACSVQHLVVVGMVYKNTDLEESVRMGAIDDTRRSISPPQAEETSKVVQNRRLLERVEQRRLDFERLHESGTDVKLLSEAFSNIVANSRTGNLLSLSLEMGIDQDILLYGKSIDAPCFLQCGLKHLWQRMTDTFHATLRSLAISNISMERLQLFNTHGAENYSLACNELGNMNLDKLATSLASLKSLSVSFSDMIVDEESTRGREGGDTDADDIDEKNEEGCGRRDLADSRGIRASETSHYMGLAKLLRLTSHLQSLDLHQYEPIMTDGSHRHELFQYVSEMEPPPKLMRAELCNLDVEEEHLLAFIQRTNVRRLSLSNIRLISGNFDSIFAYCSSDAADIEELHFRHLFDGWRRVWFKGPFNEQTPMVVPSGLRNSKLVLIRKGVEVRRPILYRLR